MGLGSKEIPQMWKQLSDEQKAEYQTKAHQINSGDVA